MKKGSFVAGLFTGIAVVLAVVQLVVIIAVGAGLAASINKISTDGFIEWLEEYSDNYQSSQSGTEISGSSKLDTILQLIDQKFILDIDEQLLEDYMYKGLIVGLDDEYSCYYTAEEVAASATDFSGNYSGIGATVQIDTTTYEKTITQIYDDSPAQEGGMQVGDIIIAVDGEDVTLYDLDSVVYLIKGEEGSQVEITVLRGEEELTLTLTRRALSASMVSYEMLDNKVGYIYLSQFLEIAVDQMKAAIDDLNSQGMEALVLDLRNNPGGELETVLSISEMFLENGSDICSITEKDGSTVNYSTDQDPICTVPMTVLVNGDSASGSELLSGALKCNERATIIGTQTFGKGIVQSFYSLSDGSVVKLTTAYYYLPDGSCIHKVGVTPDIVIELDEESDQDNQLAKALEVLNK